MRRSALLRQKLEALSSEAVVTALAHLPGWRLATQQTADGASAAKQIIEKEYAFKDFHQAWSFMNSLVPFVNETDHHPEWSNVYNRVRVCLTTHDVGNNISIKDIRLAEKMEEASKKLL